MRRASLGRPTAGDRQTLLELGFAKRGEEDAGGLRPFLLTEEGHAFDDSANVYDDREEARRLLREAYLRTPATQALMQGLHGRGTVSVAGALHLLARHRLADANDISGFRGMLTVLNAMGVVSYSKKHQTVRIVAPMPDEEAPLSSVRVVAPERPYSNIRHLRETIRSCKSYVWWADPHFEKRGFEPLADEADSTKIKEIRILSGTRPSPAEVADYKRFGEEMKLIGISVEYRVVAPPERTWHDRFIVSEDKAWNVPPLGAVSKGSYSQFTETSRPPFESWWDAATPVPTIQVSGTVPAATTSQTHGA